MGSKSFLSSDKFAMVNKMNNLDKKKPVVLFVRSTENCNGGCFMCNFAHRSSQPFLAKDQLKKIAAEAKKSGIKLIRLTGGEPLLDPNTPEYIGYLHSKGFKTSIITNGYLLPSRAFSLAQKGLDQIILSFDGSTSKLHDRIRGLPGLYENAIQGIKDIKTANENIAIRINTVVSPYNIADLGRMLDVLISLEANQWSLIPLKGLSNLWRQREFDEWLLMYNNFQETVKNTDKIKLLGYSKQWAGRNESEIKEYFTSGIPYTPEGKCDLSSRVRFYDPKTEKLSACNCVPWRLKDVDFNTNITLEGLNDGTIQPLVNYLRENGPKICKGCEPINVFLGENPSILEEDILLF